MCPMPTRSDMAPLLPDLAGPADYPQIRAYTVELAAALSDADATIQSMPDASPAKWHLAHASWFFEQFVLVPHIAGYAVFDPAFAFLFNSYYEAAGPRHARPARGMLSRPSLAEIYTYRQHIDEWMNRALSRPELQALITLGMHHEQQHQELLLTDILHAFSANPLRPAARPAHVAPLPSAPSGRTHFLSFEGGLERIGAPADAFHFDCEGPPHQVFLAPFQLGQHLITNADWQAFIDDGGYEAPLLWLADGWARRVAEGWQAPLYWDDADGAQEMTLCGLQPREPHAAVAHVSYFEADAFARWAGARLPTEAEWEVAARRASADLTGLYGQAWQWTASAFSAYPGFRPAAGAVGEYNGKFMSGQMVLRGSSQATSPGHARRAYRNFFAPEKRWQFSGLRLAKDCDDV